MNVEKLKELYACEKKYARLAAIFAVPALLIFVSALLYMLISGNALKLSVAGTGALIIVVFFVLAGVFCFIELEYVSKEEAYIISILEQFIQSEGVAKENFELIYNGAEHKYLLAFRNQTINYDDLDKKVQNLLYELNKIVDKKMRVRLL